MEGQVRSVTDGNAVYPLKENALVKLIQTEDFGGHVTQEDIPQSLDRAAVLLGAPPVSALLAVQHGTYRFSEVAAAMLALYFRGKAGDVVPCDGVFPAVVRCPFAAFIRPAFLFGIAAPMVSKLCAVREIENQCACLRHGDLRHLFRKNFLVKLRYAEDFCTFLHEYGCRSTV